MLLYFFAELLTYYVRQGRMRTPAQGNALGSERIEKKDFVFLLYE